MFVRNAANYYLNFKVVYFMLVCSFAAIILLSIVHWIIEKYDKHATFSSLSFSLFWENLLGLVEFCESFGRTLGNNHGFVIQNTNIYYNLDLFVKETGKISGWDGTEEKERLCQPESQLNTITENCSERWKGSHLIQNFLGWVFESNI